MTEPVGGSLAETFARLHGASRDDPDPSAAVRRRRLDALESLLRDNEEAFCAAIAEDFGGRSAHETRLLEFFPALAAIRHARRQLSSWMRPQRRSPAIWFRPGRAEVRFQPLGVVGVIVPWNYPLLLAVAPLVAAFAAGNRAMVKMSEFVPATSALLARCVESRFGDDELRVVRGEADVAQAFSALPFDHLLFTGSTAVGREVMRAAAANLTPVTLELGGKSPAIVAAGFPLQRAAGRIAVGKAVNAGQTCVAPDYVLLPQGSEAAFVDALGAALARCYPQIAVTPDYGAIVSERHYRRLVALLDDAQAKGATLVPLTAAAPDPERRRLPPLALLGVRDEMRVMQEEIFGPILPIVPYRDMDAALAYVNARPRPLALYLFDDDRHRVGQVLATTVSGGVTVNDTLLHAALDDLPFGGVGESGMGHYHGRDGFLAMSRQKAVFYQSRLSGTGLLAPPYGTLCERLLRLLLR